MFTLCLTLLIITGGAAFLAFNIGAIFGEYLPRAWALPLYWVFEYGVKAFGAIALLTVLFAFLSFG